MLWTVRKNRRGFEAGGKCIGFATTWAGVGIRPCHLTSFRGTNSWMDGVTVMLTIAAVITVADIYHCARHLMHVELSYQWTSFCCTFFFFF